jgi:branched-subunit amino acid transport protein
VNVTTEMSWWLVVWLSLGAYAFKAVGFVIIGGRTLPGWLERSLALIPAALLTALALKDTFSTGTELMFDERVIGLCVAGFSAWRRMPLIVTVVLAAAATAFVRAL